MRNIHTLTWVNLGVLIIIITSLYIGERSDDFGRLMDDLDTAAIVKIEPKEMKAAASLEETPAHMFYVQGNSFIGLSASYDGREEIVFPTHVNGVKMKEIKNTTGIQMPNVKKVVVQEGIESLGDYAFDKWGLESIELPETLQKVGLFALYGNHIKNLKIPEGVNEIEPFSLTQESEDYKVLIPEHLKGTLFYPLTSIDATLYYYKREG